MDPVGGPVVELGGRHPLPAVIAPYRRVLCRASCPGLRVLPVTPAGLGVELDPQTRRETQNQKPAVPSRTGGRPPPPPHTTALLSWRRAYLSPRWFRGSAT